METQTANQSPVRHATLVDRDGLRVVRVTLEPHAAVPEHHSPFDVVVTVVRGDGVFTVQGAERNVQTGDIVEMQPRCRHALRAGSGGLEIIIVHARIAPR